MWIRHSLRWAYASNTDDIIETAEVRHDEFRNGWDTSGKRYFFSTDREPFVARLEPTAANPDGPPVVYSPVGFEVTLPERDGQLRMEMSVQMDVTDLGLIWEIERAIKYPEPIAVVYRVYLASKIPEKPTPEATLNVSLVDISTNGTTLTGTLTRARLVDRGFPRNVFREDNYPGLVQ